MSRRARVSARGFAVVVLAASVGVAWPQSQPRRAAPAGEAGPPGSFRVHDPSTIVRCGDRYWFFHTGRGVPSRWSPDLVSWQAGPPVFSSPPAWVQQTVPGHRGGFWAPDVIAHGGRYLLYYSVSTWGKNTSAIALATNVTLDPADPRFRWSDQGIVVQSSAADDFNAIDPSVMLDTQGRLWLAFGSFWSGIKLAELDPATGRRKSLSLPFHSLARHREIEAPCLAAHNGYYYLFVNWGLCCRGVDSTYNVRVGRSREVTGPYVDAAGVELCSGGGTPFLETSGRFIGPGHVGLLREGTNDWVSCHFYDGERRGAGTLAIGKLSWDTNGWPVGGALRVSEVQPDQERKR